MVSRKKQRKAARQAEIAAEEQTRPSNEEWFSRVVEAATAYRSNNFAKLDKIELSLNTPNQCAEYVTIFCETMAAMRPLFSEKQLGRAIWYFNGTGCEVWQKVKKADLDRFAQALLSLKTLYRDVFSNLSEMSPEAHTQEHQLHMACYMLWDMDGGLSYLEHEAVYDVLEYALSLNNENCWYSALHGLGHRAIKNNRAIRLIDNFLSKNSLKLSYYIKQYALAARTGSVQ